MRVSGKKSARVRLPHRRKSPSRHDPSVLELVRSGVERFILRDANIVSFRRAILRAAKKGENSAHPLTGATFRRIVKKAIKDRYLRVTREGNTKTKSDRRSAR